MGLANVQLVNISLRLSYRCQLSLAAGGTKLFSASRSRARAGREFVHPPQTQYFTIVPTYTYFYLASFSISIYVG